MHVENEFLCKTRDGGLKIHNPEVWLSGSFFEFRLFSFTRIFLNPKIITTSDALRKYSPKMWVQFKFVMNFENRYFPISRNCYFSDEGPLTYFTKYSVDSCRHECRSKMALKACNCIPISTIRKSVNIILKILFELPKTQVESAIQFATTKTSNAWRMFGKGTASILMSHAAACRNATRLTTISKSSKKSEFISITTIVPQTSQPRFNLLTTSSLLTKDLKVSELWACCPTSAVYWGCFLESRCCQ